MTPEQWDAPSLCAGWVRDVVAHLFSYEDVSLPGVIGKVPRGQTHEAAPET